MGLLDIYNASQAQLTVNDPDLVTQYPATVTGTPTPTQNPGGPVKNFDQAYDSSRTYLSTVVASGLSTLENTLPITNLDVEDSRVQGGPNVDITTRYPALATGTPDRATNFSVTAPFVSGAPPKNFIPSWAPNNTYLNANQIAGTNSGVLYDTLGITNYDINDPNVNGGPLDDTSTVYPPLVTGMPNPFANPAAPRNFSQFWLPNNTYLAFNPIRGINSGILRNTLKVTNLDTTSPGVDGGIPYDQYKDPTIYPVDVNSTEPTRGYFAQPGTPPNKFYQTYDSTNTYSDFIRAYI